MRQIAVLMAGGNGTRFWPVSRKNTPKQFLKMFGEKTLIHEAFERNALVFGKENVFVCTNPLQKKMVKENIGLPDDRIVLEPFPRDTAAAIGLSAIFAMEKFGECIVAMLPSDHLVPDKKAYSLALHKAVKIAEQGNEIVTIGITPSYPATSLGYIETGEKLGENAWKVRMFREKPNERTAREYIDSGNFFWNSGMFVFKASVMLDALQRFLPKHSEGLEKIRKAGFDRKTMEKEFEKLEKTSIDYGVMEKAQNASVVKADFAWDDVGSWNALERIAASDSEKNSVMGKFFGLDSRNNVVFSDSGIVAGIGLENMVIAKFGEAVMVCKKNDVEKIKELVKKMQENSSLKEFV